MTILADLKGFTLAHNIYFIENNNVIGNTQCAIKDMPEVLCELAFRKNAEKVVLSGNRKYSSDIREKLYHTFLVKYQEECPFEIEQM